MPRRMHSPYALIATLALASASAAFAQTPQATAPAEPTPQVRQQMAAVHEKMAACLKSERPIAECKAEMWDDCHALKGASGCPMMGPMGGGMGPGMMGGGYRHGPGTMQGGTTPQSPEK
jgi:hypothetical protein